MTTTTLSKVEAAQRLGVHVNTLDQWAKRDYGPPRAKLGRKVVYDEALVESWLAQQFSDDEKTPAELQLDEGRMQKLGRAAAASQDTDELWIEKWLAVAPPMTDDQRQKIGRILAGSAGAR